MMKKSPVFALILLVVIGCGSSDEDEPTLVGSWEIVSIDDQPLSSVASLLTFALSFAFGFGTEGQIQGLETKITENEVVIAADGSYSLNLGFESTVTKSDGVLVTLRQIFITNGKYTLSGSTLSFVVEEETVILEPKDVWDSLNYTEEHSPISIEETTWSLSGDTLTLRSTGATGTIVLMRRAE
jgi:hypothetical protein